VLCAILGYAGAYSAKRAQTEALLSGAGAVAVFRPGCVEILDFVTSAPVSVAAAASGVVSAARVGSSSRRTKETTIQAAVNLDGEGKAEVHTGIGFLDHMLSAFSKHSHIDVKLTCKVGVGLGSVSAFCRDVVAVRLHCRPLGWPASDSLCSFFARFVVVDVLNFPFCPRPRYLCWPASSHPPPSPRLPGRSGGG
jgi:hypothetical protein